jgi:hypothetical protein
MPSLNVSAETERQYPRGPNGLHDLCRDEIVKIDALLAGAPTKADAKKLRSRRKTCRMMMKWCKTRAGYVVPDGAT